MPKPPGTLRVVLWNCRDFGKDVYYRYQSIENNRDKAKYIMSYIEDKDVDIACLMETSDKTIDYFYFLSNGDPRNANGDLINPIDNPFLWKSRRNDGRGDMEYYIFRTTVHNLENYVIIYRKGVYLADRYSQSINVESLNLNDQLKPLSIRSNAVFRLQYKFGEILKNIGIGFFHAPSSAGNKNIDGRRKVMNEMVDWFQTGYTIPNTDLDNVEERTRCDLIIWSGDFNFRKNAKENEFTDLQNILTGKGYSHRGPFKNLEPASTSLRVLSTMAGMSKDIEIIAKQYQRGDANLGDILDQSDDYANPFDQVWAKRPGKDWDENLLPRFPLQSITMDATYEQFGRRALASLENRAVTNLSYFFTNAVHNQGSKKGKMAQAEETRDSLLPDLNTKVAVFGLAINNQYTVDDNWLVNHYKLFVNRVNQFFTMSTKRVRKQIVQNLNVNHMARNRTTSEYYTGLIEVQDSELTLDDQKNAALLELEKGALYLNSTIRCFSKDYTRRFSKFMAELLTAIVHFERNGKPPGVANFHDKFWEQICMDREESPYSIRRHISTPLLNYTGLMAHSPALAGYQVFFSDHVPVLYDINIQTWSNTIEAEIRAEAEAAAQAAAQASPPAAPQPAAAADANEDLPMGRASGVES